MSSMQYHYLPMLVTYPKETLVALTHVYVFMRDYMSSFAPNIL
jgi:hypothetical protein